MSENPQVSCQVPADWKAKIQHLAVLRGKTPEEIIYEALGQYLGEEQSSYENRFNRLEVEVSSLNTNIASLTSTVKDLQQRLIAAASIISIPETNSITVSKMIPNININSMYQEDLEDEPDEILYEFLDPKDR
jgi:predicted nuclease with TOPRIM domain